MNDFFIVAAHNVVAALVLALVVCAVTRVWRNPPVAHVLWLLVLLKLVAPPVMRVDWMGWIAERSPASVARPASAETALTMPRSADEASPFLPDAPVVWHSQNSHATLDDKAAALDRAATPDLARGQIAIATIADPWLSWSRVRPVLFIAWLGGSATWLIVSLWRIIRFHMLVKGTLPAPCRLHDVVGEICEKMGLKRWPDVRFVESAATPLLWCLGRQPTIVLSRSLVGELDQRQVAMVIAHELAHLCRRDHWARCLELTVTALYWWNPLVWWVRRELHQAEEHCCDAWVGWVFPNGARTYAETLLKAAEGLAPSRRAPLLASPFLRSQSLKERIEKILKGGTQRTMTLATSLAVIASAVLVVPSFVQSTETDEAPTTIAAVPASASQDGPAITDSTAPRDADVDSATTAQKIQEKQTDRVITRMAGKVTVAGTGEPVAGAKVRISIIDVTAPNAAGSRRAVIGETDVEGKYSVDVPLGHARAWYVELPPGYWIDGYEFLEDFVTTPEKPVFTKDYVVQPGPVWAVRILASDGIRPLPKFMVNANQWKNGSHVGTATHSDEQGAARLTIPTVPGEFQVSIADEEQRFDRVAPAKITFDSGFRPDQAARVQPGDQSDEHRIIDKGGRTATVVGARAKIDGGLVTIEFDVKPLPVRVLGRVTGVVVDAEGQPIEGAETAIVMGERNGGSAMTRYKGTTDASGKFVIEKIPAADMESKSTVVSVVVTKDGYAGVDSKDYDLPVDSDTPRDVGRIRLAKGNSIRIRVLDPQGAPVAGAWLEPVADYAARTQLAITDSSGEGVIRNLRKGVQPIIVNYANLGANPQIVVGGRDETVVIRLAPGFGFPRAKPAAATAPARPTPLKTGDLAPELQVSGWTDGKSRKLSDFRGKVVVLDFWGMWCGACVKEIPMMQRLDARYKDRGVVFLAIHTAEAELNQVQELARQNEWEAAIAVDQRTADDKQGNIHSGITVERYGVRGYPTLIVVGRDGKLAFTSGAFESKEEVETLMKRAAKALSIPWPLDENGPEEELLDQVSKIQEFLFSEAIDQALKKS